MTYFPHEDRLILVQDGRLKFCVDGVVDGLDFDPYLHARVQGTAALATAAASVLRVHGYPHWSTVAVLVCSSLGIGHHDQHRNDHQRHQAGQNYQGKAQVHADGTRSRVHTLLDSEEEFVDASVVARTPGRGWAWRRVRKVIVRMRRVIVVVFLLEEVVVFRVHVLLFLYHARLGVLQRRLVVVWPRVLVLLLPVGGVLRQTRLLHIIQDLQGILLPTLTMHDLEHDDQASMCGTICASNGFAWNKIQPQGNVLLL